MPATYVLQNGLRNHYHLEIRQLTVKNGWDVDIKIKWYKTSQWFLSPPRFILIVVAKLIFLASVVKTLVKHQLNVVK